VPDRLALIDTLTVASLNLHHGFEKNGTPFGVTAAVCQLDAAVICVQEAWQPFGAGSEPEVTDQLADAAEKLGMSMRRAVMCIRPGFGSEHDTGQHDTGQHDTGQSSGELSIAVLTTLPVTGYRVIELGTARGDIIPRLAQVILLELPDGGVLRLVNTHLTHRFTSPLQLRLLQRQLAPGPATVIVGDLNMPRMIAARWPGYADMVRGRTYPADRPLIQLDHMLASRNLERISGRVLPPAGSDHLPVWAEFRVHQGRSSQRASSASR
jgi:endonuclease/exonuclease/phosphatase family metal-dependent hydrolase